MTQAGQAGLRLRLQWTDPVTGDLFNPVLGLPISLGCEFQAMPSQLETGRVSRMVLNSQQVAPFQVLLLPDPEGGVRFHTQGLSPPNPVTLVNGQPQSQCQLTNGDVLQLGSYEIAVAFVQGEDECPIPPTQLDCPVQPTVALEPQYGLKCPKCHRISPYEHAKLGCQWCGTSLAAAVTMLLPDIAPED